MGIKVGRNGSKIYQGLSRYGINIKLCDTGPAQKLILSSENWYMFTLSHLSEYSITIYLGGVLASSPGPSPRRETWYTVCTCANYSIIFSVNSTEPTIV